MRTYLISYDLAEPRRNKHAMASAIMSLGQSWSRPLEHTWYVRAESEETDVRDRLAHLLDDEDGLIVQSVSEDALLANTSLRWFRQRQAQHDLIPLTTNVLAFPVVQEMAASLDGARYAEAC